MDDKDFVNKLENVPKPDVSATESQKQLKLALMNAKKSSIWGIWLLIVPAFFLFCVTVKYFFQWNWGIMDNFIEFMARLDKDVSTWWVTPVFFVLLPILCALINTLAIMHFAYDKVRKELIVSIRLKWLNIILAIISLGIVAIVLLYGIMENAHHRAIEQIEKQERVRG